LASKREANAHDLIHAESMLETGADLACRAVCQSCKQLLRRRCDSDTAARKSLEPTHPKEPCYVIPGLLREPY
jgi:hypothetical protein